MYRNASNSYCSKMFHHHADHSLASPGTFNVCYWPRMWRTLLLLLLLLLLMMIFQMEYNGDLLAVLNFHTPWPDLCHSAEFPREGTVKNQRQILKIVGKVKRIRDDLVNAFPFDCTNGTVSVEEHLKLAAATVGFATKTIAHAVAAVRFDWLCMLLLGINGNFHASWLNEWCVRANHQPNQQFNSCSWLMMYAARTNKLHFVIGHVLCREWIVDKRCRCCWCQRRLLPLLLRRRLLLIFAIPNLTHFLGG